jgi:hypothetical protein
MQEEATKGLNPRDEQRANSMADEGGASAAVVETADPGPRPAENRRPWGLMATAAACGGLVAYWLRRRS